MPNRGSNAEMAMRDAHLARVVGDNVRRIRTSRGMTQVAVGRAASVTHRTVLNVEKGMGASLVTLCAIADALDVEAADLLAEPSVEPVAS
jgi:transcriptional regulator with XRE-family HTH domain